MTNTITRIDNYSNNSKKGLSSMNKNKVHTIEKEGSKANNHNDSSIDIIENKLYLKQKKHHTNDNSNYDEPSDTSEETIE